MIHFMVMLIDSVSDGPIILPMPYDWKSADTSSTGELHLWPHQSLPPKGYAGTVLGAAVLACIPLMAFLGTFALWSILAFLLVPLFGLKRALDRNRNDRQFLEVLTLDGKTAHLERHNPTGHCQNWDCNRYWTKVRLHKENGPVPNYVTLRGNGREVEIGAFLSEEERKSLYRELKAAFAR